MSNIRFTEIHIWQILIGRVSAPFRNGISRGSDVPTSRIPRIGGAAQPVARMSSRIAQKLVTAARTELSLHARLIPAVGGSVTIRR